MLREKSCGAVVFVRKDGVAKYLLLNYVRGSGIGKGNR